MESKTLENLEFAKILLIIASFAASRAAKDQIINSEVLTDSHCIFDKLAETQEYMQCTDSGLSLNPSGLRDIREIINLLKTSSTVLGAEDFLTIRANLEIATALKKELNAHDKELIKTFRRILEPVKNITSLTSLSERINDCFDEIGQIKPNASPTLAGIRREYAHMVKQIEKDLNAFIHTHAELIQDKYFTIRNDRYVVPINAASQNQIQGIVHDQSATGQTMFIEPLQFLVANNRLTQLRLSETEEIKRILTNLTGIVYQNLNALTEQFKIMVWLDVLRAKSTFARRYKASHPEISGNGELCLQNARHPLLHPECVPLDISLNENQVCIIITGPNGGGKTVAMKTVGLNALLMQTGNFVLASGNPRLPIFQEILSDIGESQSIENNLSTFTAHLKRLKEIEEKADLHSLVLIDEICVGTDPIEGGALASGFLKEICSRGAYAIVTSHYDSLKNLAFTTKGFINAAMEFDYETFRPTFRFILGLPGKSNALAMARVFGLPNSILKDLEAANSGTMQKEKGLLESIELERNRAEKLRRAYVGKLENLRTKEQEIEETWTKLQEFRKTKRDKLTEEFTQELRKRLKQIETTIGQLKGLIASEKSTELEKAVTEARDTHRLIKESIKELSEAPELQTPITTPYDITDFKENMKVILVNSKRKGIITRLLTNNKAEVDFDGLVLQIDLTELVPMSAAEKHKGLDTFETGKIYAPRPFVRSELDIRGLRVEEAINKLEDYLKSATDAGYGRVFIIHGKGTGALHKAVTEFLRNSPWRKKFRSGRYGEGDLGVTVVVFDPAADKQDNSQ